MTQQKNPVRGRPKVPAAKARALFMGARVSPEEAKEIRDAIKRSKKTKSNWIRDALLEKARTP